MDTLAFPFSNFLKYSDLIIKDERHGFRFNAQRPAPSEGVTKQLKMDMAPPSSTVPLSRSSPRPPPSQKVPISPMTRRDSIFVDSSLLLSKLNKIGSERTESKAVTPASSVIPGTVSFSI